MVCVSRRMINKATPLEDLFSLEISAHSDGVIARKELQSVALKTSWLNEDLLDVSSQSFRVKGDPENSSEPMDSDDKDAAKGSSGPRRSTRSSTRQSSGNEGSSASSGAGAGDDGDDDDNKRRRSGEQKVDTTEAGEAMEAEEDEESKERANPDISGIPGFCPPWQNPIPQETQEELQAAMDEQMAQQGLIPPPTLQPEVQVQPDPRLLRVPQVDLVPTEAPQVQDTLPSSDPAAPSPPPIDPEFSAEEEQERQARADMDRMDAGDSSSSAPSTRSTTPEELGEEEERAASGGGTPDEEMSRTPSPSPSSGKTSPLPPANMDEDESSAM